MGYVLAYVQGITADEEADDIFYEKMIEDYENDADPGIRTDYPQGSVCFFRSGRSYGSFQ